jgi:predicted MFS family arabinose efflux permease
MLSFGLPAAARGLPALGVALVALGASASMQDVAMNSQAVAIERRIARPIMSSFHAAFSIGGIVGAGIGAVTARLELSFRPTFAAVAAVLSVALLVANRWLLDSPETDRRPAHVARDRSRLPQRNALLALGCIGFASFIAEGAAADWTTIYLRDNTGSSEAIAAIGFVVFSATMTAGRLVGDRVAARFGALPLIRAGTALAGIGLAIALAIGTTAAGFFGFAVLGAGLSIVVPQVFSAAGAIAPLRAAAALSAVSSISYLGFLTGPSSIGAVAHWVSLRTALLIPAVLVLAASLLASRLHAAADSA